MTPASFRMFYTNSPCILGEGAIIERLRRNSDFELDPHIVNSAFIYDDPKRESLAAIYRQYLDIGRQFNLPLILSTPTWRASRERISEAGCADKDVNGDNFRFLDELRNECGPYAKKVAVGGLLSCRGDAFNPDEALSAPEARKFHAWQAEKLAEAGVDFLLAATLPVLSEAIGLSAALSKTGMPYIISFVARPQGTLIDGTPLKDAIQSIDAAVSPKPLTYIVNCTHASIFKQALFDEVNSSPLVRQRIGGLLANTAALKPEELDESENLVTEAPEIFGQLVGDLKNHLGMKILGGCCGTDDRHIRQLAKRLAQ
ncbi:homocysteine S-methyltransferase family protein [Desulfosarcina sp.]|uniref:homocysteine S-methyltransferase family protein n=1 Tax=Desulfosarcina sp. TaxID=2027861 RepID=UPI0029AC029A|nr:homocysteine S-methyltransferase family protein [Desulfosarcina sp.]MDX2492137.1 homocysteine S-methyltransferase family protein [Desulfosarcina sp.]